MKLLSMLSNSIRNYQMPEGFEWATGDKQVVMQGSTHDLRHEPTLFERGNIHFNNAPHAAYSEDLYNNSPPPRPLLQVQLPQNVAGPSVHHQADGEFMGDVQYRTNRRPGGVRLPVQYIDPSRRAPLAGRII